MKQSARLDRLEAAEGNGFVHPEIFYICGPQTDSVTGETHTELFFANIVGEGLGFNQVVKAELESNEAFQERVEGTLERLKRERDEASRVG